MANSTSVIFLIFSLFCLANATPLPAYVFPTHLAITPQAGRPGTIFVITATTLPASRTPISVNATLTPQTTTPTTYVTQLYDTGFPPDGGFRNGVYTGIWDSTNARQDVYNISICFSRTNCASSELILSNLQDCKELIPQYNNLNKRRINVVLAFVNYNNSGKQVEPPNEYARALIEKNNYSLLSVEPFRSNRDKFNFWYVPINLIAPPRQVADIHFENITTPLIKLASNCVVPNKQIIGLIEEEFRQNAVRTVGNGIAKTSTSPDYYVNDYDSGINTMSQILVHEFGHSFGSLADEYIVYSNSTAGVLRYPEQFFNSSQIICQPNADNSGLTCNASREAQETCKNTARWHDGVGNSCGRDGVIDCASNESNGYLLNPAANLEGNCVLGGRYPNLFRSDFNNIMRFPYVERPEDAPRYSFGFQNQRTLCKRIVALTGSAGGICKQLCLNGCTANQRCVSGRCQNTNA